MFIVRMLPGKRTAGTLRKRRASASPRAGGGAALGGTLVLGYGSLADDVCSSVGETLRKVCTAAREASVTE